jgi:hypothetical protein
VDWVLYDMIGIYLLDVLPAILFLQQSDGVLYGVLIDGAQLGDHTGDLGRLEVEVGLGLSWLAGFHEAADVLDDMMDKSDKKVVL